MLFGIILIHVGWYFKSKLFYSLWGEICILFSHYLPLFMYWCRQQNLLLCLNLWLYDSCISLRFTADIPSGMTWRNLMMWSKGVFHSKIFRGKSSLNSSSLGCKMHENQNKHTGLNLLFYIRQCSLSHTRIRIL